MFGRLRHLHPARLAQSLPVSLTLSTAIHVAVAAVIVGAGAARQPIVEAFARSAPHRDRALPKPNETFEGPSVSLWAEPKNPPMALPDQPPGSPMPDKPQRDDTEPVPNAFGEAAGKGVASMSTDGAELMQVVKLGDWQPALRRGEGKRHGIKGLDAALPLDEPFPRAPASKTLASLDEDPVTLPHRESVLPPEEAMVVMKRVSKPRPDTVTAIGMEASQPEVSDSEVPPVDSWTAALSPIRPSHGGLPASATQPTAAGAVRDLGRPDAGGGEDDGKGSALADSDPFGKLLSAEFRGGKVIARGGRAFKPVSPQISSKGWRDMIGLSHPSADFQVQIDAEGRVRNVKLVRSSGSNEVDLPAELSLYQWWIEPSHDRAKRPVPDVLPIRLEWK